MKKLLYVDDASSLRQLIEMVLSKKYQLTVAQNGEEGYQLAQTEQFDLIISDVNMPVMNGFEMVKLIKNLENYKFTPILMMTTETSDEMRTQGKEIGATGWIVKPFDPEKLTRLIERLIWISQLQETK